MTDWLMCKRFFFPPAWMQTDGDATLLSNTNPLFHPFRRCTKVILSLIHSAADLLQSNTHKLRLCVAEWRKMCVSVLEKKKKAKTTNIHQSIYLPSHVQNRINTTIGNIFLYWREFILHLRNTINSDVSCWPAQIKEIYQSGYLNFNVSVKKIK